jgi:lipopolysaccharide transport system permease protein
VCRDNSDLRGEGNSNRRHSLQRTCDARTKAELGPISALLDPEVPWRYWQAGVAMSAYLSGIYESRYLWMTLLIALVFGRLFNQPVLEYAPYILSGMIVWEFFMSTVAGGSLSFVHADAYIKQYHHPLAIYTLRTTLTNLMVLTMASLSLIGWVLLARPQNFGWCWLAALSIFPFVTLIAWPLATCLAYIGTRFRDLPHALGLIMQAMWFVSPIYFQPGMFRDGGLGGLIDYNPIYHILEILRAPLLNGDWPTTVNFAVSAATAVAFYIIAVLVGMTWERKVIFYL